MFWHSPEDRYLFHSWLCTFRRPNSFVSVSFPTYHDILFILSSKYLVREKHKLHCMGFEVLTAVVMRSYIFWHITSCSPLKVKRRFAGTCRLHLQGRRTGQTSSACHLLHSAFLLALFFDPEYGGDMFLSAGARPVKTRD
jgi:hypothetical protein